MARAVTAEAGPPFRVVERVQPVVDRDLVACLHVAPRKDLDAAPHRVGLTRVVEVAAGWEEDGAVFPVELAQVPLVLVRELRDLRCREWRAESSAEDELARRKGAASEYAMALCTGVPDLHVPDHGSGPRAQEGHQIEVARRMSERGEADGGFASELRPVVHHVRHPLEQWVRERASSRVRVWHDLDT
jgi:hypothetical protein